MLWRTSTTDLLGWAYTIVVIIGLSSRCPVVLADASDLYNDKPLVTVLEDRFQFQAHVQESDSLWMIQFCTTTHEVCKNMAIAYETISQLFKGIFQLGFVPTDTAEGDEVARMFQVPTDRAPLMYWFLDDKTKPIQIDSEIGGASELVNQMAQKINDILDERSRKLGIKDNNKYTKTKQQQEDQNQQQKKRKKTGSSSTVTVSGPEEWEEKVLNNPLVTMVAFTAPWCGHCKMLKPDWEEAAEKVEGEKCQFIWVDATDPANEPIAAQFQVKGFPTILIFPGGSPKQPNMARQYPGDRKASAMVKYILGEVDQSGTPKEIPELTNAQLLEEECKGHNHICVLAALPHILDSGAEGRNKHRELLAKVAKAFRGGAFSFLWFEGGSQPALESALEMTAGFPALAAYSMDRHAFANLHGSFNEKPMTKFLHGVTSGRVPIGKLKKEKVPKIEDVEPWDGKDGQLPEEEFDLADIMGSSDDDEEDGAAGGGDAVNDEL